MAQSMAQSALGVRPNQAFDKKLVGIAVATVGEKFVKFTLTEEGKKFEDGTNSIKIAFGDLPDTPRFTPRDGDVESPQNGRQFRIRMNSDGDAVEAIQPVTGMFKVQLIDLGKRENKESDPAPYEKTFEKDGKKTSHLEFFAVYKIVDGFYAGVQLPAYNLHYKFENDGEGNARFAGNFENKKATRLFQLAEWLSLHELDKTPIKWAKDGNILPELLLRGTKGKANKVNAVIKNGYIAEILPVEDEPGFVEQTPAADDVDAEFQKPTKSAKKVKPVDDDEDL